MALKSIGHALGYGAWLIKEIFSAGTTAAIAAFSPDSGLHPIVIVYPLRVTTEWQRFWLSTSITATPGTMSIGFRRDPAGSERMYLLVQAAFGKDPIAQIEGIMDMEQRLCPSAADTPLDPATVEWTPYSDRGPVRDAPPAERLD